MRVWPDWSTIVCRACKAVSASLWPDLDCPQTSHVSININSLQVATILLWKLFFENPVLQANVCEKMQNSCVNTYEIVRENLTRQINGSIAKIAQIVLIKSRDQPMKNGVQLPNTQLHAHIGNANRQRGSFCQDYCGASLLVEKKSNQYCGFCKALVAIFEKTSFFSLLKLFRDKFS